MPYRVALNTRTAASARFGHGVYGPVENGLMVESSLLAAHAASCLNLLQTAVPSLEAQVLKTTMHQDELLHPQEEGQQ